MEKKGKTKEGPEWIFPMCMMFVAGELLLAFAVFPFPLNLLGFCGLFFAVAAICLMRWELSHWEMKIKKS